MKKLHTKIVKDADRFPEITARKLRAKEREEDDIIRKKKAIKGYTWRQSKVTTHSDGSPVWYLSPIALKETRAGQVTKINKKYKR